MTLVSLETDFPLAFDSLDHLYPHGTARDNHINERFNAKLFRLMLQDEKPFYELKVLDLGCAGGGFVRSCINRGALAVGIEGSDFSKKRLREEWATLADKFLFTADISRPFSLLNDQKVSLLFDVITSWEVFEHLPEERIETAIQNIRVHLKETGLAILSISPNEEIVGGNRLHLCKKPKTWWIDQFAEMGLFHLPEYLTFFNQQFIRGPKQTAPGSFHLILSSHPECAPSLPKVSWKEKLFDYWIGSSLQRNICKFLLYKL